MDRVARGEAHEDVLDARLDRSRRVEILRGEDGRDAGHGTDVGAKRRKCRQPTDEVVVEIADDRELAVSRLDSMIRVRREEVAGPVPSSVGLADLADPDIPYALEHGEDS